MTQYRIVSVKGASKPRFLQFKTVTTKRILVTPWWQLWRRLYEDREIEKWRFIPERAHAEVNGKGKYTDPEKCPTHIDKDDGHRYVSTYFGHEDFMEPRGLIWFTKTYPDIQKYFDELLIARVKYLADKKAEAEAQTIYL